MLNYKNIQVDLSNCDKEPIHIIGRIQPHGFLLIINKHTFVVEQVSRNTPDFLPFSSAEDLLQKKIHDLLSDHEPAFNLNSLLEPDHANPDILFFGGKKFFGFSHISGNHIILECEPYTPYPEEEKIKHNHLLSQLHKQLAPLQTIESLGTTVCEAVRNIINYDRVDIMQFDTDWHTEVIAERCNENLDSYLRHHFPATDIPEPARNLLVQKPIRHIPDVNAEAIEIVPYYNPATGQPSNILKSELRNPSEIHLEYLRNAGVSATISFSIVVKGQLWGTLSCHNIKPAFLDVWKRQLCELITQIFADVIAAVQETRDIKQFEVFKKNEQALISDLSQYPELILGLTQTKQSLLNFTQSTGVALVLNKEVFTCGKTPSSSQINNLTSWLAQFTDEKVFSTRTLSLHFPEAAAYPEIASGFLALEISKFDREYLLFFKQEIKETRIWAGNPEKPTVSSDMRIHPRKSFEKWQEVVKGKSQPWNINEIEIAQIFVKDLTAIQLRNQANSMEQVNAQLNTTAKLLAVKNSQLKDIALIMSHNLRAPIANIEGLHSIYKDSPSETMANWVIDNLKEVADNMRGTITDLESIVNSRLDEQLRFEEVDLNQMIQKEIQNQGTILEESGGDVKTELDVPTFTLPKIYLESILHNFIFNAFKYRSPDRKLQILIKTWKEPGKVYLSITDNGLGINLEKAGDKLFGLYRTFHEHKQAKGLGLYLTKIQIESLGGQVSVQSELNVGTTFTITFPMTT
ncbi:ATP-binding protein [Adhaeribacter aquaticus]|uniref:ATP-binding protein n=1 Tax=Adhaeribacter aquaticus TaxID=299567 RepID=UPI0003FF59C6|nr:ATP-binding protein [Adhaeribacter aquaticus]